MKKLISVILVALMLVAFVGCGNDKKTQESVTTLKFGMGVVAEYAGATSADGDTNGEGEVLANIAAVLVDKDGKIVKCELDTADFACEYTSEGVAVVDGEFLTKYELGDNYNMKAYGGSAKEWYEQIDALEAVCVGKTVDEVKALVVDGYKGNDEVIAAGCTIGISELISAIEAAVNNAADSSATANDTLAIGVATDVSKADATEDAAGEIEFEINIVAAAKNGGKVTVMDTDVVVATFGFDAKGVTATEAGAIASKKALGDNYNMKTYGGAAKEWYEQAAEFNAACAGKTADEIAALVVEGYGVDTLKAAGCTIAISGMADAAVKAAK